MNLEMWLNDRVSVKQTVLDEIDGRQALEIDLRGSATTGGDNGRLILFGNRRTLRALVERMADAIGLQVDDPTDQPAPAEDLGVPAHG